MSIGWPDALTWYRLLTDWGSITGGVLALGSAVALIIVTRQISDKQIAALTASLQADMMLRLTDKFDSPPFQKKLELAASACLAHLKTKNPGVDVDDVIDFFDDAAFLVERGALDIQMLWHAFYHWIRLFYESSEGYIDQYRKEEGAVWNYLHSIYPRLNQLEKSSSPHAYKVKLDDAELERELRKIAAPLPDAPA